MIMFLILTSSEVVQTHDTVALMQFNQRSLTHGWCNGLVICCMVSGVDLS